MKKRYPLTQHTKRISDWIKGLQGQPGWESLLECLEQIAEGQDANKVLGLNRGRVKNGPRAVATFKKNMIPIWVASVMRELQVKRPEAIAKASVAWDMDYETVERYAQRLDAVLDEGGNFDYEALLPKA